MADRYLGSELNSLTGFATNDGTHVGLGDTDDTIFNTVRACGMHVALLLVECVDDQQALVIISFQRTEHAWLRISHLLDMPQVTFEVVQLLPDRFAELLSSGLLLLGHTQILFARVLPIRARLLCWRIAGSTSLAVELVNNRFGLLASLVEQPQVSRILDIRRCASRVHQ